LLKQEVAFFDKEEVGVLTSRLGSDCQAVVRALSTNINVALRNALQAIGQCQPVTSRSNDVVYSCQDPVPASALVMHYSEQLTCKHLQVHL